MNVNVKQRINARKVVLSFIYQQRFFASLQGQENVAIESLFIDNVFKTDDKKFDTAKKEYEKTIKKYITKTVTEDDLTSFMGLFFDKRDKDDVDFDYIFKVGRNFPKHQKTIIKEVNKLAESFSFDEMDTMDQAIFILGYTEWKELETPKEILINELIELAKRYSDAGAPKLINGIMHKIVNAKKT